MKKVFLPLLSLVLIALLDSCGTAKHYSYFENIDSINWNNYPGVLHESRIMPKDMLTITVSTTDPVAATPFNLSVSNTLNAGGHLSSTAGSLQGYLVDNDGNINFPIVGKIHVQGLTKEECQNVIHDKIIPYMSESEKPIVTVRMSSYHVTVMGEVKRPMNVSVTSEKMNILEALAEAGDMGQYGVRNDVLLIRTDADGRRHHVHLNMNDANVINSPYYYVQQNDIIYVKPNKVAAGNSVIGSSTTIWFSVIGIVTSLSSLVVNILR